MPEVKKKIEIGAGNAHSFELRSIETSIGLTVHSRQFGSEGHTFVVVQNGSDTLSQLVLSPTEKLQVTQVGNETIEWLRQRTGISELEVESVGTRIGIVTDTVDQNKCKIVDLDHASSEVPSWVVTDDNIFKPLEGHESDNDDVRAIKEKAKAAAVLHIRSSFHHQNYIPMSENITLIPVTDALKNRVAEAGDGKLIGNYEYLVLQDTGDGYTFLSTRMGKPKVLASSIAEIKVSANGSGAQTLGKLIEKTVGEAGANGAGAKIKGRILDLLKAKLINGVEDGPDASYLIGHTEEMISDAAIATVEEKLHASLPDAAKDVIRRKNGDALAKLNDNFDEKYKDRSFVPLVDFNDLPEPIVSLLIPNLDNRDFVKSIIIRHQLERTSNERAWADATNFLQKVGISALGGESEAVKYFSMYYIQYSKHVNLWEPADLSNLLADLENAVDGEPLVLSRVEYSLGETISDFALTAEQVAALKKVKRSGDVKNKVVLAMAIHGFSDHMIRMGLQHAGKYEPVDLEIQYGTWANRALEIQTMIERSEKVRTGLSAEKTGIRSLEGPFHYFPEAQVTYPPVVIEALGELYTEYNQMFAHLIRANREWESDYQYAFGADGWPVNGWVQIDMNGLTQKQLDEFAQMGRNLVRETLRGQIFEIENSLAMYGLLSDIFSTYENDSTFKTRFRQSLDDMRAKYSYIDENGEKQPKKIAILGVTDQKYQAMRQAEFGKHEGEILTDAEVMDISGFDTLMGPEEFKEYYEKVQSTGSEGEYLFYVRSSDPIAKLKDPNAEVEHPLLGIDEYRQFIKANAITFNVDNPAWPADSGRRINDTKGYLRPMKMAYEIRSVEDLKSVDFQKHLHSLGISTADILAGEVTLRAKPEEGTYGCYGHVWGDIKDREFLHALDKELKQRGTYVIQPEMKANMVFNESDGKWYSYIDRNFFSFVNGASVFMSGFRFYVPYDSLEAQRGRIHGTDAMVLEEIRTANHVVDENV